MLSFLFLLCQRAAMFEERRALGTLAFICAERHAKYYKRSRLPREGRGWQSCSRAYLRGRTKLGRKVESRPLSLVLLIESWCTTCLNVLCFLMLSLYIAIIYNFPLSNCFGLPGHSTPLPPFPPDTKALGVTRTRMISLSKALTIKAMVFSSSIQKNTDLYIDTRETID